MMQEKAIRTLGGWGIGVLLGLGAACAGGDTPPTDAEIENQIAVKYAGAQVAAAGAGGGGGSGGSGGSGSTANPPAGGAGGSGAMAMAGSGNMDPPPMGMGGGGSSSECDGFALLQSKCSGGSCHSGGSLTTFVESEDAAKDFVGQTSAICAGQGDMSPIFDPDTPAASLVVKKITASTSCGLRMPLGASTQAYTDPELDCIEDWISSL